MTLSIGTRKRGWRNSQARSFGNRVRFSVIPALTALVIGVPMTARASNPYPEELRATLGLSYTPSCTLCHSAGLGGNVGPVNTPFGKSMVARGLLGATSAELDAGFSPDGGTPDPTLVSALAKMQVDQVDSDGDGALDLDELTWGGDPNTYDGLKSNPNQALNYGCSVSRPASANGLSGAVLSIAILVLVGARTRPTPCRPGRRVICRQIKRRGRC